MKKLALFVAAIAAVPVMLVTSAFADSPGQLAGGDNLYLVRNVTKNTSYGYSTAVACDETVKYSVEVSNTQFGALENVTVKANLGTGAINVSATNGDGTTVTSNGHVSVSTPTNGQLQYVAGSTNLYSINGTLIRSLADGVTGAGVNVGALAGSTREFVQFQAKVSCTTPPKQIQVCQLDTKKIVTIDESDFDSSKYSKNLADCAKTPGQITVCDTTNKTIVTIAEDKFDSSKYSKDMSDCNSPVTTVTELPHTGPTGVMLVGASLAALTAGAAYFVQRRKILG